MEGLELNINDYLPLRDVVYKNIRDAILSGALKPGERLMENELADMLGVSRTPIREAMRKLDIEGYVEIMPRKGAVVREVTDQEIRDVLVIRSALEALAAMHACEKITEQQKKDLIRSQMEFEKAAAEGNMDLMAQKDTEFHDIIFSSTHNDRLMHIVNNLREQVYRFRLTYLFDKTHLNAIVTEHQEIMAAIVNNNVSEAQRFSAEHVDNQITAITTYKK